MSKELEKFQRAYKPLGKTADDVIDRYKSHCTNRAHLQSMLVETSKEIGRCVQAAKDKGLAGANIGAFVNDADVKSALSTGEGFLADLDREEVKFKKILTDVKSTSTKLDALGSDIAKEVAKRKKKSDRKVAKVGSDSLPEMEKLLKQVKSDVQNMKDEITTMENPPFTAKSVSKKYNGWIDTEVKKTKSDRKARDEGETDKQSFDMRLVKKHQANFVKAVNGVKAQLAGAEKCYNAKDIAGAEKCFETAQSLLKAMAKIYDPYAREMKRKGRGQKVAMQHDKDGKAILAFIDTMEKTLPAVQKLIKSRMRASI